MNSSRDAPLNSLASNKLQKVTNLITPNVLCIPCGTLLSPHKTIK